VIVKRFWMDSFWESFWIARFHQGRQGTSILVLGAGSESESEEYRSRNSSAGIEVVVSDLSGGRALTDCPDVNNWIFWVTSDMLKHEDFYCKGSLDFIGNSFNVDNTFGNLALRRHPINPPESDISKPPTASFLACLSRVNDLRVDLQMIKRERCDRQQMSEILWQFWLTRYGTIWGTLIPLSENGKVQTILSMLVSYLKC